MGNINWWETASEGDCINTDSWNDFVDYVKHSSCTDFIIYSSCTSTGQAFKFTQNGNNSMIYGSDTSGDTFIIYSTSTDSYPYISLSGSGDIKLITDTGKVMFGTYTADNTVTIQGYIEIKDKDGNVRKLAVVD